MNKDLIEQRFNSSIRELELVTFSTGFMLDPEVSDVLIQLLNSSRNKTKDEMLGDHVSYVDRMSFEITSSIEKIIRIANKDLKL